MLELRNLRYLVALSRRLNYARAADDLGITQSALSRSIQTLENEFGVRLFDRGRAGVAPTTAGRQIIERATGLLANAEDLERYFRETAAGETGRLRFGMAPVPARALLAASLSERLQAAPGIKNEVVVRGMDALWPMLVTGEIEFLVGPATQIPDTMRIRSESLGRFPVSLIVRPDHPLLSDEAGEASFPLLMSSPSFLSLSTPDNLPPGTSGAAHVIEDFDTLIHLTRSSDAIWLTSAYAIAGELAAEQLCELPHAATIYDGYFDVAILSLDRRSQSPSAQLIKQSLRRQLNALAKSYRAGSAGPDR
jgi:DNA-binding transcriptional LysR family regulator